MAELFNHGWPIWPAMVRGDPARRGPRGLQRLPVTRLGLPSLAVTIGTLTLYRGIAQGILPTDTIGGFPADLANIGVVPIPGTHTSRTRSRSSPCSGGRLRRRAPRDARSAGRSSRSAPDQEAAFFAGIRVKRIKFWLFVLSGTLSGFAGVLWTLRFASARYDSGIGIELFVVTIVLLGGVSIFGGRGTIIGVVARRRRARLPADGDDRRPDSRAGPEHRRRRTARSPA